LRECPGLVDSMGTRFAKQGVGEHRGRPASTAVRQPRYGRTGQEYQSADAENETRTVRQAVARKAENRACCWVRVHDESAVSLSNGWINFQQGRRCARQSVYAAGHRRRTSLIDEQAAAEVSWQDFQKAAADWDPS